VSFAEIVAQEFRDAKLDVSPFEQKQLALYAHEIEHWNGAVNLTALSGAGLIRRLIVEPVWVGHHLQMSGVLADVGSGNGSPGIPLCITRRLSAACLVEPRLKRAAFLRHAVSKLELKRVTVQRSRIEEMPIQSFTADWICLQGIDPAPRLIEGLRRISSATTRVVWITSLEDAPAGNAEKIDIPKSNTKIWVFRLDQT